MHNSCDMRTNVAVIISSMTPFEDSMPDSAM
jgi:hypothetical protein